MKDFIDAERKRRQRDGALLSCKEGAVLSSLQESRRKKWGRWGWVGRKDEHENLNRRQGGIVVSVQIGIEVCDIIDLGNSDKPTRSRS